MDIAQIVDVGDVDAGRSCRPTASSLARRWSTRSGKRSARPAQEIDAVGVVVAGDELAVPSPRCGAAPGPLEQQVHGRARVVREMGVVAAVLVAAAGIVRCDR